VQLEAAELDRRLTGWRPPAALPPGVLAKYRASVASASLGAVTSGAGALAPQEKMSSQPTTR
jgi:hypothetical protein